MSQASKILAICAKASLFLLLGTFSAHDGFCPGRPLTLTGLHCFPAMDDADLSALLDELGSDGSEDESAFERTLDDILGEDGDSEDLWTIDPQPTEDHTSKVVKVQPIKESRGGELETGSRSPAKDAADGSSVRSRSLGAGRDVSRVQPISAPKPVQLERLSADEEAYRAPETERAAEKSSPELPIGDRQSSQQSAQTARESFVQQPLVSVEAPHSEGPVKTVPVRGQGILPKSPPPEAKKRESSDERVGPNGIEQPSKLQVLAKQRSDAAKTPKVAAREEGEKGALPASAPAVSVDSWQVQPKEVSDSDSLQESHPAAPQLYGPEELDLARAEVEAKLKLRERDLERLLEDSVQGAGALEVEKAAGNASKKETEGLESRKVAPEEHLERQPSALQIVSPCSDRQS